MQSSPSNNLQNYIKLVKTRLLTKKDHKHTIVQSNIWITK